MSGHRVPFADELARARLAYITAGQPPLGAPRRAAGEPDARAEHDAGAEQDAEGEGTEPAANSPAGSTTRASPLDRLFLTTRQVVAVLLLLLLCGIVVALTVMRQSSASQLPVEQPVLHDTPSPAPPSATAAAPVRVHVLGAVVSPGVVVVAEGDIVEDAVRAAGGLGPDADPAELNLAAPVGDGQQVIVGTTAEPRGEVIDESRGSGSGTNQGLTNLNTATTAELEQLPGIGPVLAGQIVAWREANGGFATVEQLQEVSGIGPKSFAKLAPLVMT